MNRARNVAAKPKAIVPPKILDFLPTIAATSLPIPI